MRLLPLGLTAPRSPAEELLEDDGIDNATRAQRWANRLAEHASLLRPPLTDPLEG